MDCTKCGNPNVIIKEEQSGQYLCKDCVNVYPNGTFTKEKKSDKIYIFGLSRHMKVWINVLKE